MRCPFKRGRHAPRPGRPLFSLLRDHLEQQCPSGVGPLCASVEHFDAAVLSAFSALTLGDAARLSESLARLCGLFASSRALSPRFCDSLLAHPLLPALVSAFDAPRMLPFVERAAELFVNVSAFSAAFVRQFLALLGYEKVTHVRDALGPRHPIPLLLAYNIYRDHGLGSWALGQCADLEFYVAQTAAAAERGDSEMLFFAPFVLVSLLRSGPIPGAVARHSKFVSAIAAALVVAPREAVVALLWAVYFWFQQNAQNGDLWHALSPLFVQGIAAMLESDDRNIVRLALYANAYLWLIPEIERRPLKIEKVMKAEFKLQLILQFAGGDDPEISAYAFALLTNYMAFDRSTFAAVMSNDFALNIALEVLDAGAARAKTEAVHFLCSFLRNHLMEELEGQPLLRIMQTMMDALELEDDQVTADILELFIAMARLAPECVAFLLEREFDTWLLESPQRLRLPFADERLYDLLAYSRRTAACKPFGRR